MILITAPHFDLTREPRLLEYGHKYLDRYTGVKV